MDGENHLFSNRKYYLIKNVNVCVFLSYNICKYMYISGADPGFQVRGVHFKKLHRAEGGMKNFGVFRVKNHDFTPKNHIFSNCGWRSENFWGISCEKSRFYAKKSNFFPILGWGHTCILCDIQGNLSKQKTSRVDFVWFGIYRYSNWYMLSL